MPDFRSTTKRSRVWLIALPFWVWMAVRGKCMSLGRAVLSISMPVVLLLINWVRYWVKKWRWVASSPRLV